MQLLPKYYTQLQRISCPKAKKKTESENETVHRKAACTLLCKRTKCGDVKVLSCEHNPFPTYIAEVL